MRTDGASRSRIGEYLLGLMQDDERAQFEHEVEGDPSLRQALDSFARQLSRLDETVDSAPVPAGLWDKIDAAVSNTPQDPVISHRQPARRFRRFSLSAIAAALVAGIGLGYGVGYLTVSQPQPVVMVVLNTPENIPGAVFEAFADNSVRVVPLADFVVPEGKILQVWTLYDQQVGPVALGTMRTSSSVVLERQSLPVPAENQLYEITLEPAPGSPTGKPTGPILVKGFAKEI